MNLLSVLTPLSTVLGGVVGGPVGASVAPMLVSTLAGAFGLDAGADEQAVVEAIQTNPNAQQIVASVEERVGKSLQEVEASILETINQTAREELKSESLFVKLARPFNIWVIGVVTGGYGACLVAATGYAVFTGNATALNTLVGNAGTLGICLAPCGAVAGVSAWGRSKEKLAGRDSPLMSAVKKVIK
jgi:hypothetical protein